MYTQRYRTDQSFGHLTVEVKLMARSIPPNTSTCNEDMFDKVLFLACGHLVYNGPPSGLKKWLTESNLWDPERAMTTSITDMATRWHSAGNSGCIWLDMFGSACRRALKIQCPRLIPTPFVKTYIGLWISSSEGLPATSLL